jgi:hypothetical protein
MIFLATNGSNVQWRSTSHHCFENKSGWKFKGVKFS